MNNQIYKPEFLPYYLEEAEKYKLTDKEALLYGFIRFYTKNNPSFYFDNEQLAKMIRGTKRTVNRAFKKFSKLGIFEITYKVKAGGGKIRFVNEMDKMSLGNSELHKMSLLKRQNVASEKERYINPALEEKKSPTSPGKNKINKNSSTTTYSILETLTEKMGREEAIDLAKKSARAKNTRFSLDLLDVSVKEFVKFNEGVIKPDRVVYYFKKWLEIENWDKRWDQVEVDI
jgi:hypothetical protein